MTINYTTLTAAKTTSGSIANWVNRSDAPVTNILTEAQAWIYERLRVREMLSSGTLAFSSDSASASLPSDFLDPVQVKVYNQTAELPYVDPAALAQDLDSGGSVRAGTPARYTILGTNAILDVKVSSSTSMALLYYATPTALGTSNETNFLTTRYPTALRLACLAFAYQHLKDSERATANFALAEAAIKAANDSAENARRGQRTMRAVASAMSYTNLVSDMEVAGSIKSMVARREVASELVLSSAEAWIYDRLRVREMMIDAAVTFSINTATTSAPTDFIDPILFTPYGAERELPYVNETALQQTRNSAGTIESGTPSRWTVIGTTLYVDVRASAAYSGMLTYYGRPPALGTGNETNFLTTRYPTLVRHVVLGVAFEQLGDLEKSASYLKLAEEAIKQANALNALSRRNQRASRIDTAVMSYDLLTADKSVAGSIRHMLGRDDLPAELILTEAQAYIYQRLRSREMLTQADFTFSSGSSEAPLPDDFLDGVQFLPDGWGYPLEFYHEEKLIQQRDSDGALVSSTPSKWSIIGTTAIIDCSASEDMAGQLIYYAKPDPLSTTNGTNFLTSRYPTLLRFACIAKGFEYLQAMPDGGQTFAVRAQDNVKMAEMHLAEAMRTNDLWRRGQSVPAF